MAEREFRRKLLPLKDFGIVAGEAALVSSALYIGSQLGMANLYTDLVQSLGQVQSLALNLQELPRVIADPGKLKPLTMGVGFVIGVATTVGNMVDVFSKLKGKAQINL